MNPEDWPSRMIDQPPPVKARWLLADPDRYFTQIRAERHAEAREYVTTQLADAAQARRDRSLIGRMRRRLRCAKASQANR